MIHNYKQLLQYRAEAHPRRNAIIYKNEYISYQELNIYAKKAAQWFLENGIKKGDCIAFLDFNNPSYVHLVNACLFSGIIPVSINWRSTAKEISYILLDADCKMFLFGTNFEVQCLEANENISIPAYNIEIVSQNIFYNSGDLQFYIPDVSENDIGLLIYTSGTTGNPKGVMLSYDNIYQMYLSLRDETPLFGPASVNLISGPWHAIVGIGYFIFGIYTGCTNVLMPYFDPLETIRLIETHRITNVFLAPVMMQVICNLEEVVEHNLSSLQNIQYGGSPIAADQLKMCYATFNCFFTQGYGLTETSGIATALRFDDHKKILTSEDPEIKQLLFSAGKPYPGVEIKIISENGTPVSIGETGEVCLKGKVVSLGYWKPKGENEKKFLPDGWFMTGDMGYLNEAGYLFLVDRKNDLIISKGINIYPAEIENVLNLHPQIKECAVIGIRDEMQGEIICVVVVVKDQIFTLRELRTWALHKIAEHKIPVRLEFIDNLPRNATGKILRKELRKIYT